MLSEKIYLLDRLSEYISWTHHDELFEKATLEVSEKHFSDCQDRAMADALARIKDCPMDEEKFLAMCQELLDERLNYKTKLVFNRLVADKLKEVVNQYAEEYV